MKITDPSPRVFIVDDSAIFLNTVVRIITERNRFSIAGTLSHGLKADAEILEANPDILIIDMQMPDKSGIDVIKDLRRSNTNLKVLALSVCEEGDTIAEALKAGANGYLSKLRGIENLIPVMEKLLKGESYFTDEAILLATK